MTESKKLRGVLTPAGNLDFPNAESSVERDDDARHDARIAHDALPVLRQLANTMRLNLSSLQFAEADCRSKGLNATASTLASLISAFQIDIAAAAPYTED